LNQASSSNPHFLHRLQVPVEGPSERFLPPTPGFPLFKQWTIPSSKGNPFFTFYSWVCFSFTLPLFFPKEKTLITIGFFPPCPLRLASGFLWGFGHPQKILPLSPQGCIHSSPSAGKRPPLLLFPLPLGNTNKLIDFFFFFFFFPPPFCSFPHSQYAVRSPPSLRRTPTRLS